MSMVALMRELAIDQLTPAERDEVGLAALRQPEFIAEKLNEQIASGWPGITCDGEMAAWLLATAREALRS